MSDLVPSRPSPLARRDDVETIAEAHAALIAARERAKAQLSALEERVGSLNRWREAARRHPLAALGGAFLVGYAIARALGRR